MQALLLATIVGSIASTQASIYGMSSNWTIEPGWQYAPQCQIAEALGPSGTITNVLKTFGVADFNAPPLFIEEQSFLNLTTDGSKLYFTIPPFEPVELLIHDPKNKSQETSIWLEEQWKAKYGYTDDTWKDTPAASYWFPFNGTEGLPRFATESRLTEQGGVCQNENSGTADCGVTVNSITKRLSNQAGEECNDYLLDPAALSTVPTVVSSIESYVPCKFGMQVILDAVTMIPNTDPPRVAAWNGMMVFSQQKSCGALLTCELSDCTRPAAVSYFTGFVAEYTTAPTTAPPTSPTTAQPTMAPTMAPTTSPTTSPTASPTASPTKNPEASDAIALSDGSVVVMLLCLATVAATAL